MIFGKSKVSYLASPVLIYLFCLFLLSQTALAQDSQPAQPAKAAPAPAQTASAGVKPNPKCKDDDPASGNWGSCFDQDNMRLIVGFEQAGVSSAESKQKFFFDYFLYLPLFSGGKGSKVDPIFNHKFSAWFNGRINSVPQQITTQFGTFVSTFATQVSNLKVNEVAQSADIFAGVEYRLKGSDASGTSINILAGGGVTTPLTPRETLEVFQVPKDPKTGNVFDPTFLVRYPNVKTDNVAFALADRDRFFRAYYGGIRIRKHYLDDNGKAKHQLPLMADLTYGVDESITRGRIRGGVLTGELFAPVPWKDGLIYFFFTGKIKPARAKITDPLILTPGLICTAPSTPTGCIAVPSPNTTLVTVQQTDRDYYKLGVAVDLIKVIDAIASATSAAKSATK